MATAMEGGVEGLMTGAGARRQRSDSLVMADTAPAAPMQIVVRHKNR